MIRSQQLGWELQLVIGSQVGPQVDRQPLLARETTYSLDELGQLVVVGTTQLFLCGRQERGARTSFPVNRLPRKDDESSVAALHILVLAVS